MLKSLPLRQRALKPDTPRSPLASPRASRSHGREDGHHVPRPQLTSWPTRVHGAASPLGPDPAPGLPAPQTPRVWAALSLPGLGASEPVPAGSTLRGGHDVKLRLHRSHLERAVPGLGAGQGRGARGDQRNSRTPLSQTLLITTGAARQRLQLCSGSRERARLRAGGQSRSPGDSGF